MYLKTADPIRSVETPKGFDVFAAQILGSRKRQEDTALVAEIKGGLLLALSDGMGGHPHGDAAARITIDTLHETMKTASARSPQGWSHALHRAVAAANAAVIEFGQTAELPPPAEPGGKVKLPGSTLVAVLLLPRYDCWVFASVGDSYLYRLTPTGAFAQMNSLHENEEGKLTSSLGGPMKHVDGLEEVRLLHDGDVFLLASDGIDVLDADAIEALVAREAPTREIAAELLAAIEAKDHPKQDNATVIVARRAPGTARTERIRSTSSAAVQQL